MTAADRSALRRSLEDRCDTIAERWYVAIAATGFTAHTAASVRAHLQSGTRQIVTALLSDPFEPEMARAVGEALVRLHYSHPQALGRTLSILGREFVTDLSGDDLHTLYPRLMDVLGAVAAGFSAASRATILKEQEDVRTALLAARQQAEERLRYEEQLRAREQATRAAAEAERDRLQQILDVLPEGVLIADEAGHFVLSNRAATAIIGIGLAGLALPLIDQTAPTMNILRRLDGSSLPLEDLPMESAILRGAEIRGEQFLVHNPVSGQDVPVLVNSAPLHDRDGRLMGAVAVFQDITALKDFERTRELFLSAVSHDLKSPLTSIQGVAQLIHRRLDQEGTEQSVRLAQSLETVFKSVQSMTRLLDELGDVTRLQLGQTLNLDCTPTDLVALVRGVVERYQATTQHPIRLQERTPAIVGVVDGPRLERVVTNLLTNALKYSPAGGAVTVRIGQEETAAGPQAVLVVQDQGIGIPAADLPHVFELFHRGANVVGQIEGTGMGLASARQIVRQHGGTLTVESEEGVGATVTLSMPLRDDESASG